MSHQKISLQSILIIKVLNINIQLLSVKNQLISQEKEDRYKKKEEEREEEEEEEGRRCSLSLMKTDTPTDKVSI